MKRFLYGFLIFLMAGMPILSPAEEQKEPLPVVIMGGGVGALTAAVYLQRAGINTLVLEGANPGGAIAQSPNVHNWPGELEISGQALVEKIKSQAESNGATIVAKEAIGVDFHKRPFSITTRDVYDPEKIETIQAKACIIATGSSPKLLGVPGESGDKGYWTRGVYSCAVCDGPLYRGKTVAVIGGGDSAILEADYLSKMAKKVYVILRSDRFKTVETLRKEALLKKDNVEVIYNTKVNQIAGDEVRVTHLNLSTAKELPVDGVFLAIGATPNTEIFKTQLELDSYGYIKLAKDQSTTIPGVYAIGDVVDPIYKQAISASGDGAKAALQVEKYLSEIGVANPLHQKPPPIAIEKKENPSSSLSNVSFIAKITDISSPDELYAQIGKNQTLVVDFYSPYCGPCKELAPKIENAAENYSGKISFLTVDVTRFPELTSNYNVYGVPTLLIFDKQGKVIKKASGVNEIQKVLEHLDKYASK